MPEKLSPDGPVAVTDSGWPGSIIAALSTGFGRLQFPESPKWNGVEKRLENLLDLERDQLMLWSPVAMGCGIALWFAFANQSWWIGFILTCLGIAAATRLFDRESRWLRSLLWFSLLSALGCALIWLRSWNVAEPILDKPTVTQFDAQIENVEIISARDQVRLTLHTGEKQGLPPRVRVNLPLNQMNDRLRPEAQIALRARLMPPAQPALPGAYDFSRRAWFMGLGATGQVLGKIEILQSPEPIFAFDDMRYSLSHHVRSNMSGGAGAIGATLATGDRGAITEEDAEAMRRSGLAHLLSISGLHVTAVVGATYLFVLKLLALVPPLALRYRLPIVAAGFAALAALGYTLLTGAQVPTIRACVAAVLVLVAMMMGRNAITLRMVAAGAIFVLILWPESLVGPSFQLSFAAVTAIIALHEHPRMKALVSRRDEGLAKRIGRIIFALFLTGLVVEIALMPIALFHFHKAGIYGALANIVAIPLTTFLIMPLEALALLLDNVGLGKPIWWLCEKLLLSLLGLAHFVASSPGAVTMLPTFSTTAFALAIAGGLWICLWKQKWRYLGLIPSVIGVIWMFGTRAPDLYITGDGRHAAIRSESGDLAMLRTRSGDFIRDIILENAGIDEEPRPIAQWPNADCNTDSCTIALEAAGRKWIILATRSNHYIPAMALSAACIRADIVISERRLPASCEPSWMKADRMMLEQTGGMTIDLENMKISTVRQWTGQHEWTAFNGSKD